MGHRSHIGDRRDADTQCAQGAHRGLTARTRTLDVNIEVLDALVNGGAARHFRGHLSSEWSGLARALEALATGRCPRQSVALTVSDRDDGVVERGVHVGNTVGNVLPDLL